MPNNGLATVVLLGLWFTAAYALIDDDHEPKLNRLDENPCVRNGSSVRQLSADIWVLHKNYTDCSSTANNASEHTALRVHTSSNAVSSNPVVFVTRSGNRVQTWHLPQNPRTFNTTYNSSKRTICSRPSTYNDSSTDVLLYMDVFTSSDDDVEYTFEFEPVEDFILGLNQNISFNVSPNEPQLYYYKIPDDLSSVRVVVSSQNPENCAIVSVQNASCPVNDQLENAMTKGAYQTMTTSASLVVTAYDVVQDRDFFIVVVSANSEVCQGNNLPNTNFPAQSGGNHTDHMTLVIQKLKPATSYVGAMVVPAAVFIFVGIIICFIFVFNIFSCTFIPLQCTNGVKMRCSCCVQSVEDYEYILDAGDSTDGETDSDINEKTPLSITSRNSIYGGATSERDDVPTEVGYSPAKDYNVEQSGAFRNLLKESETEIMLPQLMKQGFPNLENNYKVYGWNTITVGIFYALPAFQLVFSQQNMLTANGDQDICYYNFKCAHPFTHLSAFNNVWSNIGYFIMGVTFLIIVARRDYSAYQERKKNKQKFDKYGVPQFYGVYYAMGFGLVMEAFMSAFYHICPSGNNFQFDTAFMFIIGGLLIVKMLQARHPDIQANAFVAFFSFAVVIFLTFIGIWEWSKAQTKISLAILAAIGFVVFAISYYFFHDWRYGHIIEWQTYKRVWTWLKSWCILCNRKEKARRFFRPKHPYRFFKVVLLIVASLVAGITMVIKDTGIATVVLALFIINFLLLMLLYILLKLWYREPITLMPVVFLIILGCLWGASFFFYFSNVSQWSESPAKSREYNKDCYLMGFYDHHDIWHFLSATAMFFSFLFLLTLDDGTKKLRREEIHVF